ncbi:PadR family transcriptional regulator [Vagococcus penaei]|uniref:PadR family transcriptional regulator n=1 Tax=Vagococcus penaei TaxID=633807 RepID=A0A1Q2D763_9ENTE|nr:PadR family transcriptional regulator [Vagococcus penaei]AQP54115.1 PadR family transcriptional regulator [Vagococcus penaei]RSU02113.1 PadR family transcriptional regulator [Vagococcus penaei]
MEDVLTDSSYLILLALLKPKHGYAIMKDIDEMTQGNVTIGPASMYTILKKLVKSGDIELEEDDHRKKIYLITEQGRQKLQVEVERRKRLVYLGEKMLRISQEVH